MFKKLKKRLEVDESQQPQPLLISKPGTAVRSSINSTLPIQIENPRDSGAPGSSSERDRDGKLDTNISMGSYDVVSSQEMKEMARAESRLGSRAEDGMSSNACMHARTHAHTHTHTPLRLPCISIASLQYLPHDNLVILKANCTSNQCFD